MDLRKFDLMVNGMPEHIRDAWASTDLATAQRMAAETPDNIPADKLQNILEYSLGVIDEDEMEDLLDGDLEDQLENLLAEGDKEDAKLPRHCIDDLEKRYVLLQKINGRYCVDVSSDDLAEINRLKDIAYSHLNNRIHRDGQGVATITIFDREGDQDLFHVELCKYPKAEVSKAEQAMEVFE